jgi:predicted metal-dependent HD superfamily phosphohydrolase
MLINHNISGIELKSQWQLLFEHSVGDRREERKVLRDLIDAYSQAHRFYHGLIHIKHILGIISTLQGQAKNYRGIQFAAWFHDVVYHPNAKDNEEKSAAYAAQVLTKLNVCPATIDAVTQMILNTKYHQAAPEDIDSQILLDADLAILGADEASYRFYVQGIRREYARLSSEEYRLGRIQVLQQFLQRSRIYYTQPMFAQYEAKARHNILLEIEALYSANSYLELIGQKSSAA